MKNKTSDLLIIDGGTVKTNEEGLIEGLGIVFGSENNPDQSKERDFFTKETFIRKKNSFSVPLYYNHGFGPIKTEVGEAVLTKSEKGWSVSAQLDLEDELGKTVYEEVKSKKHGFSTGALQHLVSREPQSNGTNFLKRWVVGEISLTERPAERNAVVYAVKSIDGTVSQEPAWEEESQAAVELRFLDESGEALGDTTDTKILEEIFTSDKVKAIEVKYTGGSVTYNVSTYDEKSGKGADITVYEYGGVENLISHLRNVLSAAEQGVKSQSEPLTEEDFNTRVTDIVNTVINEKEVKVADDELATQISELTEQINTREQELAAAMLELEARDTALTQANEKIAQLKILAGANKTIEKAKGK